MPTASNSTLPTETEPQPLLANASEEGLVTGHDSRQTRWNLGALMLDVTFFSISLAFLDPSAVLPLLLAKLGATGPIIGAFAALRSLAFNVPQVFVAYATHGRARQKPLLALIATLTRLPWLALPFFLWHADDFPTARTVALVATILLISLWALGDGVGYVPWMEIVARAFSARTRGRFFASSQLTSGLISIGVAAFAVRAILNTPRLPFPMNYALLAAIGGLCLQISLIGVLLIREPPVLSAAPPGPPKFGGNAGSPRLPLRAYFRRMPSLLRANPIFARLAAIQLLIGFGSASAPFYVLYATRHFQLGDEWGGIYQVMQAVGVVILMPLLAFLSERRGPAAGVRCIALVCLLTPLTALTLGTLSPWLFGLVFLLMGGSLGWGMWIALNHFLLSHTTDDERPIFVALLNLIFAPSALYPFLGGLLVQPTRFVTLLGVPVLFILTALVVATGFRLSLHLPAPEKTVGQDS